MSKSRGLPGNQAGLNTALLHHGPRRFNALMYLVRGEAALPCGPAARPGPGQALIEAQAYAAAAPARAGFQ